MPSRNRLPAPLRVGVGLVATAADAARDLPRELMALPIRAAGSALRATVAARRAYDVLADRGEQVLARRGRASGRAGAPMPQPEPEPSLVPRFEPDPAVADAAAAANEGSGSDRTELPIADYDHLTLGSLRARLPRLDAVDLMRLRDYEQAHAARAPVLTMIENRLAKVGGGELVR